MKPVLRAAAHDVRSDRADFQEKDSETGQGQSTSWPRSTQTHLYLSFFEAIGLPLTVHLKKWYIA